MIELLTGCMGTWLIWHWVIRPDFARSQLCASERD